MSQGEKANLEVPDIPEYSDYEPAVDGLGGGWPAVDGLRLQRMACGGWPAADGLRLRGGWLLLSPRRVVLW